MPAMLLDAEAPTALSAYLRAQGWLASSDDVVQVAPAGDGNMNCTLRVATTRGSFIVKQGRAWVEKYPSIPAPPDRTLVEAAFYQKVASHPEVATHMPALRGIDRESRVLALDDCVGLSDATAIYAGQVLGTSVVDALLGYLGALHRLPVGDPAAEPAANHAMRALNHEYIYRLPLAADPGLHARLEGLTPGLAALAVALAADAGYVSQVALLGERYLHGPSQALLHGDFFPGSWLTDGTSVKVIDPEFCFAGAPEFDYGVMAGHFILARQAAAAAQSAAAAIAQQCDGALVAAWAGVEIMRRLIGVAQLDRLDRTLAEKRALLETSRRLVLGRERLVTAVSH